MNRNLRSSVIIFGFILVTILSVTSVGTALRPVNAADQDPETTVEPQSTTASTEEQPIVEPTEVPTSEQSTDAPTEEPPSIEPTTGVTTEQPTEVQPSAEATDDPNSEIPVTAAPEETLEPEFTPEVTETATAAPEETLEPEFTPEVTETATAAPEETLEPEFTPEVTETPIPVAPEFTVALTCTENGITFVIINIGTDMESPSAFMLTLDDAANASAATPPTNLTASQFPIEFMLLAGKSTTVIAGFGQPKLILDGVLYQPETPCLPPAPPVIDVTAVCTFETAVTFTITNSGGVMTAEQGFTIITSSGETITNTFLLGTNETANVEAGYGQPTFSTGELVTTLETPCYAPTAISGTVWNDADGDAVYGAGETGIEGVTIQLFDTAGTTKSTITNADGSYTFLKLPVGNYTTKVDTATLSSDYALSFPIDSAVTIETVGTNNIVDFGFHANPTASVTGTVWLETTNYGVRDANEMGVGGVVVELVDQTGVVVAVAPVDVATGTYVFVAILSGEYTVRLAQSTLFQPNGVTWNSDETFDYETQIILATSQALANIDFGLVGTY